jgi:hypothetical protein
MAIALPGRLMVGSQPFTTPTSSDKRPAQTTDDAPPRFRRQIEAQQGMIALGNFQCRFAVAVF